MRHYKIALLILVLFVARPVAGTIYTAQRTVTTTATQLSLNTNSQLLLVNQSATTSVYLGAANVTTTTGVELKGGATLSLQLATGEVLYGITSTGTARVDTLENQR